MQLSNTGLHMQIQIQIQIHIKIQKRRQKDVGKNGLQFENQEANNLKLWSQMTI